MQPAVRGTSNRSPTTSPRRPGGSSRRSSGPAVHWPRSTTARSIACSPRPARSAPMTSPTAVRRSPASASSRSSASSPSCARPRPRSPAAVRCHDCATQWTSRHSGTVPTTCAASGRLPCRARAVRGAHRPRRLRRQPLPGGRYRSCRRYQTPEGIDVPPLYTAADLAGLDFLDTYPGLAALPARPLPDDVRHPAVDGPPVRRLLHRRGVERLLPPQPGRRARRACRSPSTWPPTAATTPTTRASPATSAWPASPSTRSTTCASSSTASRWTR